LKEFISLVIVVFVFLACGAQNNPKENSFNENEPITTIDASLESNLLPKVIAIDFPTGLSALSSSSLSQSIEPIQAIIGEEKRQLLLLNQVMNTIVETCTGLEQCRIQENTLSIQEDNETRLLGTLDFNKLNSDKRYRYELSLEIEAHKRVTFKWGLSSEDVLSIYEDDGEKITQHYYADKRQNKEAYYIEDHQNIMQNTFMISYDNSKNIYRLQSHHIDEHSSFSSNILLQNNLLVEENENMFDLNSDFLALKEGSYLLLSAMDNMNALNLIERFESSLGSFMVFNNQVEGFSFTHLENDAFVSGTVIPFRITAEN